MLLQRRPKLSGGRLKALLLLVGITGGMGVWISSIQAAALTFIDSIPITIASSSIDFYIPAVSSADSILVQATSVVVTVPAGNSFTITSASKDLQWSGQSASAILDYSCSALSVARLIIPSLNANTETLTISPRTTLCTPSTTPSGGGAPVVSSGGGGGGGGGGGYTPIVTPKPALPSITPAPALTQPDLSQLPPHIQELIKLILAQNAAKKVSAPTSKTTVKPVTPVVAPKKTFTRALRSGTRHAEVKSLQELLKKLNYYKGTTNGLYNVATKKAVQAFQLKYGLAKPTDSFYGIVGPKTRDKLNELWSAAAQ